MSWLSRLFTNAPQIRIHPTGSLTKSETELLSYIALRVKLTYPHHDEKQILEEIKEKFQLDQETASWYLDQSVKQMKAAGWVND